VKTGGCLLGIDTGASKSVAALSDGAGLLAEVSGPGMMLLGSPTEEQLRVLSGLVAELCSAAGVESDDIVHVGAGMCGVDLPKQWEEQHRALCRGLRLDPRRTTLVNDGVVALWGATLAERATILQQGSAFTSVYRAALGQEQVFDPFDFARLLDVRKEALARVSRMLDGRATRTPLASRVLDHVGVPDGEALVELLADPFGEGWKQLSRVTPVVSAAWLDGDPAATTMLETLATDLAVTVSAMARRIGPGPFEAVFGGGVLRRLAPEFLDLVGARLAELCPEAVVGTVALPPERGALVMAAHYAGLSPHALFAALEGAPATEGAGQDDEGTTGRGPTTVSPRGRTA
jgi:N-acetylglucosamine kinase-like BadF-type ATPase